MRDFVHVQDAVDIMVWLADTPRVSGLFNAGTGTARSFLDLTLAVYTAMGREPQIDWVDTPETLRAKYQYFTEARMERLKAAGCPVVPRSLEAGVADYVKSYLEQSDPYR